MSDYTEAIAVVEDWLASLRVRAELERDEAVFRARSRQRARHNLYEDKEWQKRLTKERQTKEARLRKVYGLDYDEFWALLMDQGQVCAICDRPFTSQRLPNVDHNHKTGEIRGLICASCNMSLGYLHEDAYWLKEAAIYLLAPPARRTFEGRRYTPTAPPRYNEWDDSE